MSEKCCCDCNCKKPVSFLDDPERIAQIASMVLNVPPEVKARREKNALDALRARWKSRDKDDR